MSGISGSQLPLTEARLRGRRSDAVSERTSPPRKRGGDFGSSARPLAAAAVAVLLSFGNAEFAQSEPLSWTMPTPTRPTPSWSKMQSALPRIWKLRAEDESESRYRAAAGSTRMRQSRVQSGKARFRWASSCSRGLRPGTPCWGRIRFPSWPPATARRKGSGRHRGRRSSVAWRNETSCCSMRCRCRPRFSSPESRSTRTLPCVASISECRPTARGRSSRASLQSRAHLGAGGGAHGHLVAAGSV